MKRKIFIAIIVFILLAVCGMLWHIVKIQYEKEHFAVDLLPDFTLYKSNHYPYYIPDTEKYYVIVYFKSDCQYCINELMQISDNSEIFTKASIYFITAEPIEYLKEFETNFSSSQIIFLHDRDKELLSILQIKRFPTIYIFKSDRKFVNRIVGFASVKKILSCINNE